MSQYISNKYDQFPCLSPPTKDSRIDSDIARRIGLQSIVAWKGFADEYLSPLSDWYLAPNRINTLGNLALTTF
jgi:hypothetical protein